MASNKFDVADYERRTLQAMGKIDQNKKFPGQIAYNASLCHLDTGNGSVDPKSTDEVEIASAYLALLSRRMELWGGFYQYPKCLFVHKSKKGKATVNPKDRPYLVDLDRIFVLDTSDGGAAIVTDVMVKRTPGNDAAVSFRVAVNAQHSSGFTLDTNYANNIAIEVLDHATYKDAPGNNFTKTSSTQVADRKEQVGLALNLVQYLSKQQAALAYLTFNTSLTYQHAWDGNKEKLYDVALVSVKTRVAYFAVPYKFEVQMRMPPLPGMVTVDRVVALRDFLSKNKVSGKFKTQISLHDEEESDSSDMSDSDSSDLELIVRTTLNAGRQLSMEDYGSDNSLGEGV
jgi:hypothetical protein